jgi:type I restriction enzyme, S subunit
MERMTQEKQALGSLPHGWQWMKLGELVDDPKQDLVDGPFGSNLKAEEYVDEGIPVLKIQNIKVNRLVDKRMSYVTQKKAQTLLRHSFQAGDLIITKLGEPLGLCCKVPANYPFGIIVADLMRLRPSKAKIFDDYLMYVINSEVVQNQFKKITKGTTRARVNLSIVRDLLVPVPPIPIQHALILKIEELFSELEKGKQQLETAREQLKVYRQAVLKWAFEGKLTQNFVKEGELPKGWKTDLIKNTCSNIKVGIVIKPSNFYAKINTGIPAFRSANVREFRVNNSDWVYFSKDANELNRRTQVKTGDVLLVRSGYPGTSCVVPKEYDGCNAIDILIATPDKEKILPDFLCAFNNSPLGKGLFNGKARGVAQKHLNVGEYSNLTISYPSIEEQAKIVEELQSKLANCDKLVEEIDRGLPQTEILRQSILEHAFTGKLIESPMLEQTHKAHIGETQKLTSQHRPSSQKIAAFPRAIGGINTTDLHAGVLAMVINAHEKSVKYQLTFNHVKGEKIAHLVEAEIGIDLGRVPVKDAAGPDDFPHLKKVEHRAKMKNWFGAKKLDIGYTYYPKSGIQKIISQIKEVLAKEDLNKIDQLINTFLPFDMVEAELRATLYAGWNNLLLQGNTPTDEEIVFESRENWSKRKLKIPREEFFMTLEWMRANGLMPVGKGKAVTHKKRPVKK